MQDLIECTQHVFFKDDLGEQIRVNAARLFDEVLADRNSTINGAYASAAHLSPDLILE